MALRRSEGCTGFGADIGQSIVQQRRHGADGRVADEGVVGHHEEVAVRGELAPAGEGIYEATRQASKQTGVKDINVVGYWVPNDDPAWANTFIYRVAHPSQDEAKKNWEALYADPAFPEYRKRASKFIEKVNDVNDEYYVDEVYMRPTDYSAMK